MFPHPPLLSADDAGDEGETETEDAGDEGETEGDEDETVDVEGGP